MSELQTCFPGEATLGFVDRSVHVLGVGDQKIFAVMRNLERYKELMREFLVTSDVQEDVVTAVVNFGGCPLDICLKFEVDETKKSITFRKAGGTDFEVLDGAFLQRNDRGVAVLSLAFRYSFNLPPAVEDVIRPVLSPNMDQAADRILAALKAAAEAV